MCKLLQYFLFPSLLVIFVTGVCGQIVPNGFTIPNNTLSPDGCYGVTVPILDEHSDEDDFKNTLVDTKNGKSLGAIRADTGWDRMNRGGVLPSRWSLDSTTLLWEVEGRWSPWALVLIKVVDNKIGWQVNLLTIVQRAILIRTHAAAPRKYAAAKKWNKGSGSAFPDGFTVNVRAEGDKERGGPGENVKGKPIALPMQIHAELTSNPKEIEDCPKDAQLDAALDGMVDLQGKLTVKQFYLRKEPFQNATSSSWLALTTPTAAPHPPLEYGDDVSLKGKVTRRKDEAGKFAYVLALEQKISVPASAAGPAENDVSEVHLIDFEKEGVPTPNVEALDLCDVDGTLGYSQPSKQNPVLTLRVLDYGYSRP